MGTTLTVAFEVRGRTVIGQVGDSRAYLLREDRIGQLTADQTIVAQRVMAGEITEEQARSHAERNILLQAMGAQPDVRPAFLWATLQPWDILLLCSDGLHGQMDSDDIYNAVADAPDLTTAAATLVALANSRGGPDNITVVLAQFLPGDEEERKAGLKRRGATLFGSTQ
jgi:serine/threonine protein phosphatase PrpC